MRQIKAAYDQLKLGNPEDTLQYLSRIMKRRKENDPSSLNGASRQLWAW